MLEWEVLVPDEEELAAAARRLEDAGHVVTREEPGWTAADPRGTTLRLRTG